MKSANYTKTVGLSFTTQDLRSICTPNTTQWYGIYTSSNSVKIPNGTGTGMWPNCESIPWSKGISYFPHCCHITLKGSHSDVTVISICPILWRGVNYTKIGQDVFKVQSQSRTWITMWRIKDISFFVTAVIVTLGINRNIESTVCAVRHMG